MPWIKLRPRSKTTEMPDIRKLSTKSTTQKEKEEKDSMKKLRHIFRQWKRKKRFLPKLRRTQNFTMISKNLSEKEFQK